MHWDFGESQLLRCFVPGVTADDNAIGVNDDRLAKSEFADRGRYGLYGIVVEPWIVAVGLIDESFRNSIFIGSSDTLGYVLVTPRCGVRPRKNQGGE